MNRLRLQYLADKLKISLSGHWVLVVCSVITLLICLLHALYAGCYSDFSPINGTFQNFNPIRRLLSRQIPYQDFIDYLGLGHLYLGSLMTFIFGGDYQSSLIAFRFLSIFSLASIFLSLGYAISQRYIVSVTFTNIVLVALTITLPFVHSIGITNELTNALNLAFQVGNSARYVRGMILPLTIIFILLLVLKLQSPPRIENVREQRWLLVIGIGIIAGFAFMWSNDYGMSVWLCLAIMTFWASFSYHRKFIAAVQNLALELAISWISLFFFIELFTMGNFIEWFTSTFGTGSYQLWYYNSDKSYFLYDVDTSLFMLIQAITTILYLTKLFHEKGTFFAIRRYGIPAFANMTGFCAANEYKLLAGGLNQEVALAVLLVTIFFEFVNLVVVSKGRLCAAFIFSFIVSAVWICNQSKATIGSYMFVMGRYNAELGGYMTSRYEDLASAHKFLNDEKFWSTYASAQEVVEGTFQPSGTDYIIHVLGDKQREDYLHKFKTGTFRYAATIRKEFTDWEYWAERANWFFYRELYKNWHPVFANSYELYWERNDIEGKNIISDRIDLHITQVDEATVLLTIRTICPVNGIADVFIDYSLEKKKDNNKAKIIFHTILKVENKGEIEANDAFYESNYLRAQSAEYIPMPIYNGYGELRLTALPSGYVTLNLKKAFCEKIYTITDKIVPFGCIER